MKRLILVLAFLIPAAIAAAQPADCTISGVNLAAGATSSSFSNSGTACQYWSVSWFVPTAFPAELTLQAAPDSSGVPGTWASYQAISGGSIITGANPSDTSTNALLNLSGYAPWVRVKNTGTVPITFVALGYRGTFTGSGGGGSTSYTFTSPLVLTGSVVTLPMWGSGNKPVAAGALGVAGNCAQWSAAGLSDTGSPCGSSGGSGANALGFYWVSQASNAPVNAINLGALASGLVKSSVAGSVSTPSIAVAGTDYVGPNNANTAGTGFSLDASASTVTNAYRIPNVTGFTTSVNGVMAYDTTNKNIHFGSNAVDNLAGLLPSSVTPANNDCVKWAVSGGTVTLNTAGAACNSGGGGANALGTYWVASSTNAPVNAVNLGALTSGLVKITVAGSVATPSTAVAGTDYVGLNSSNVGAASMTLDMSSVTAASAFRVQNVAGFSSILGGVIGYDTTNKNLHVGANSVNNLMAIFPATVTPANNDCVKWSVVGGVVTLNTTGAACSAGGGGGTIAVTPNLLKGDAMGNAVDSGIIATTGLIEMNAAPSNIFSFSNIGVGAPGAASSGMKLQLYGGTPGTMQSTDYAIGVEPFNVWFNSNNGGFKWYNNSVLEMAIDTNGALGIGAAPGGFFRLDVTPLSNGLVMRGNNVTITPVAVGSLVACAAGTAGTRASVNDALAPAIGSAVVAGGAAFATVHCNGTSYLVDGL